MDLDTHLAQLESTNRKFFGDTHFIVLCLVFSVVFLTILYYTGALIALTSSGLIAFFIYYFYSQMAFKKLNARITLLQTKIEMQAKESKQDHSS